MSLSKSRVHIFYTAVMDREGLNITVGGIQNYLVGLSETLCQGGFDVTIYQTANKDFRANYRGNTVVGFKTTDKDSAKKQISIVYEKVKSQIHENDIIIWGTDKLALKIKHSKSVSIQHGISFDYIPYNGLSFGSLIKSNFGGVIYKILQCAKAVKEFGKCANVICVDYNFLNWIRAVMPRSYSKNAVVIPNYATLSTNENIIHTSNNNKIKILFARRFQEMRGVDILIDVVQHCLNNHKNVEFTICGEGPMYNKLMSTVGGSPRVSITKFGVGEAENINLAHHITLVPTYGSEGTSFSLLEGMAAGAVPIVSNVGGMTNIIIDGYNGYLLNPDAKSFIEKIEFLLKNPDEMKEISLNARTTIDHGFSKEIWSKKWLNFIERLSNN